jgi:hypothetical protein
MLPLFPATGGYPGAAPGAPPTAGAPVAYPQPSAGFSGGYPAPDAPAYPGSEGSWSGYPQPGGGHPPPQQPGYAPAPGSYSHQPSFQAAAGSFSAPAPGSYSHQPSFQAAAGSFSAPAPGSYSHQPSFQAAAGSFSGPPPPTSAPLAPSPHDYGTPSHASAYPAVPSAAPSAGAAPTGYPSVAQLGQGPTPVPAAPSGTAAAPGGPQQIGPHLGHAPTFAGADGGWRCPHKTPPPHTHTTRVWQQAAAGGCMAPSLDHSKQARHALRRPSLSPSAPQQPGAHIAGGACL